MTAVRIAGRATDALPAGSWSRGLLVDVGSTFTKVTVLGPGGTVLARSAGRTTIEENVVDGLLAALEALPLPDPYRFDWAMASSSAAGGLRIASVGLTAALSGRAGVLAALGAGAKVVADEHGYLDAAARRRVRAADPHVVLVSGGLDGGDEAALMYNARCLGTDLAGSDTVVVIAGNGDIAADAEAAVVAAGAQARVADNVFPRLGEIEVDSTREVVRDIFLRHITRAKGLEELLALLRCECEPTPLAVSRGVASLPHTQDEPAVVVDIGGATTDVHSVGGRQYHKQNVSVPEPEVSRTVEGDLGMRFGAPGAVESMSPSARAEFETAYGVDLVVEAKRRHAHPAFLPATAGDAAVDRALARSAIAVAVERHAGRVVHWQRPWGDRYRVSGKDLRRSRLLLVTGGVIRSQPEPRALVREALDLVDGGLAPLDPVIGVDTGYELYAIGLVARVDPELAGSMSRALVERAAVTTTKQSG